MRGDVRSHRDVQLHIIHGTSQRWTTESTDSLNKLTRAPGEIRLAENTETRK